MNRFCKLLIVGGFIALASACNDTAQGPPPVAPEEKLNLQQGADTSHLAVAAYTHTETILSFGHRQPQSKGLRKTKNYLKTQLAQWGWQSVEQTFTAKTPKGEIEFSNVIARYAPNKGQNPWMRSADAILCAHIDSKVLPNFLGADDAASSAGAILAIAQHLHSHHPQAAKSFELVFFDGEEAINPSIIYGRDGLYGSIQYARSLQSTNANGIAPYKQKPKFGILLDMIGHKNLSIKIPSDTPKSLAQSYDVARKKLGYSDFFGFNSEPILDDHVPLNQIAKVPTMDIIGDFAASNWWHTSEDDLSLISQKSLKMSIEMTLEILSNHL